MSIAPYHTDSSSSLNKFSVNHPSPFIFAGATGTGKTLLILDIIRHRHAIFKNKIDSIIYCYEIYQSVFDEFSSYVTFNKGLIADYERTFNDPSKNYLLVIDDLLTSLSPKEGEDLAKLFSVYSHHLKINTFLISQNLFFQNKHFRSITLNSHYIFIFTMRRDKTQLKRFFSQLHPGHTDSLMRVYNEAVYGKYNYLCVDIAPTNAHAFVLRRNILPHQIEHIYVPH